MTIRGHFDGKVIVPDEPVELPVGQPLEIRLRPAGNGERRLSDGDLAARLRLLDASAGRISAPAPSAESLRRENLYEERL